MKCPECGEEQVPIQIPYVAGGEICEYDGEVCINENCPSDEQRQAEKSMEGKE